MYSILRLVRKRERDMLYSPVFLPLHNSAALDRPASPNKEIVNYLVMFGHYFPLGNSK